LIGGPADRPIRQQTIQNTIKWSIDLLDSAALRFLKALSVFAGSFSRSSTGVIAGISPADSLSMLESLVDQSLLQAVPDAADEPRFRLLLIVRDVVLDLSGASPEHDNFRLRHAEFFTSLAAEIDAGLMSEKQSHWIELADLEYDNLRSALDWALSENKSQLAVKMAGSLWPLWYGTGRLIEGRAYLLRTLALSGQIDPGERAAILNGVGALSSAVGDYASARQSCEEALDIWRQMGDQRSVANLLNNLGTLIERQGDPAIAHAMYTEAYQLLTDLGDRSRSSAVLMNIATIAMSQGALDRARDELEKALAIKQELRDELGIAQALHNLGMVHDASENPDAALDFFEQSLQMFEALGDQRLVATTLNSIGGNATTRGDLERAESVSCNARELANDINDTRAIAVATRNLGRIALAREDWPNARNLIREALDRFRQIDDVIDLIETIDLVAEMAMVRRDYTTAATISARVIQEMEQRGAQPRAARKRLHAIGSRMNSSLILNAEEKGKSLNLADVVEMALAFDPDRTSPQDPRPSPPASQSQAHGLTARELDVLRLVAEGQTNAEIGEALFISPFTAKTHVANLLGKLAVESRAAAATWAVRHGLL
jgi:DNA-binding CsgD family transcriptional regulator/tetratricopeptide (TPR) repeat protein